MMENKKAQSAEEEKMLKDIDNLIEVKVLMRGKKARNNPELTDLLNFCLGIANKDYAAMTPHLWNSVYQELKIKTRNIRLYGDPDNINQILSAFKADSRYIGGDVGVGFKDKAGQFLDELDPLAQEMQAINVIVKLPDGRLKGYNTDGQGYAQSLQEEFSKQARKLSGQKVVILGAGGTGNAIAFALASQGANLVILNRTVSKAENLAGRLNKYFKNEVAKFGAREEISSEAINSAAIISVIDDPAMPLDKYSALATIALPPTQESIEANLEGTRKLLKSLPKDIIISDVMLRENDTATISEAKKLGLPTLDGRPMVLYQAIEAFWLVNSLLLQKKDITKEQVADIMKKAAAK